MYAQVERPKENKSKAAANSLVRKRIHDKPTFQFVDNSTEVITQRNFQEIAKNSSQIEQTRSRVKPMTNINGIPVNNNAGLESEATGKHPVKFEDNRSTTKKQRVQQGIADDFSAQQVHLIQRKAWRAIRPLNVNLIGDLIAFFSPGEKWYHWHIIFDRGYNLPSVGSGYNIGYRPGKKIEKRLKKGNEKHSKEKKKMGPGELFSENVNAFNYSEKEQLSKDNNEDILLIKSIKKNENKGPYNLKTYNCQHWVKDVKADHDTLKKDPNQKIKENFNHKQYKDNYNEKIEEYKKYIEYKKVKYEKMKKNEILLSKIYNT